MDEAKMTDADMAQREKIVKSMKKNFKDFRSRYGARAKEVMYATATKMAMKEEETIEENKYSLPAGSMKPEKPVKSKSYLEKRFGHLKPGESAPLKGNPKNVKKSMKEETSEEKGEYDYEGDMAKSSLKTIIRNAQMMHDMLSEDTNLPEWVQGKITLAEDYIVSATQYMQSEMKEEVELDEISKETAWKAAEKAAQKAHVSSFAALTGKEPYKSKFEKAVRQHNKITAYASAKTPKVPFVHHEEYEDPYSATKPHTLGGWRGSNRNPAHKQETPKKKYKKMRSQERFDARFKEVDNNYPYRSDN